MGCCCCREHSYRGKCSLWLVDTQTGEVLWRRAPWRQKWTRSGTPMVREDAVSYWCMPITGTSRYLANRSVGSPVTDPDINAEWGAATHEVIDLSDTPPRIAKINDALNGSGLPSLDGGGVDSTARIAPLVPCNLLTQLTVVGTPLPGGGTGPPFYWSTTESPFQIMWASPSARIAIGTYDPDNDGEPTMAVGGIGYGRAYFDRVNLPGGGVRYDYNPSPNGTEPQIVGQTFVEFIPGGVRGYGASVGSTTLWDISFPVTPGSSTMNAVPSANQSIPWSHSFAANLDGSNPRTIDAATDGAVLQTNLLPWLVGLDFNRNSFRTTSFGVDSIRSNTGPSTYTLWSWDKASGTQTGTCSIYGVAWQDIPNGQDVYASTSSTTFGVVRRTGGNRWTRPTSAWVSGDGSINNLMESGYTLIRPNVTNDFSPTLLRLSDGEILWSLDGARCRAARMTPDGILMAGTLPS